MQTFNVGHFGGFIVLTLNFYFSSVDLQIIGWCWREAIFSSLIKNHDIWLLIDLCIAYLKQNNEDIKVSYTGKL